MDFYGGFRPGDNLFSTSLIALDVKTGKRVGAVPTPAMGGYGLMTYMHQGKQYVMLPVDGGYTALALP